MTNNDSERVWFHDDPPADIGRDPFGHWLSGFTDGEGCFRLVHYAKRNLCSTHFQITLRADDIGVLKLIQSYFRCGGITVRKHPGSKPLATFQVAKSRDIVHRVIPHFETYPLRAKKKRDFVIWKEAALLVYRASSRRIRGFGNLRGTLPKWSASERSRFLELKRFLADQRQFDSMSFPTP